jgi:hypothetical protein
MEKKQGIDHGFLLRERNEFMAVSLVRDAGRSVHSKSRRWGNGIVINGIHCQNLFRPF